MTAITIEVSQDDNEAISRLSATEEAVVGEPDHFEGGDSIVSAVIQVTTITLPMLTLLIHERIRAKRYIKVKLKGIEVTGANLDDIGKFLEGLKKE